MRIRTRLTLWYAAVMFASLALMGVLSYHEFVREAERYRAEYRAHGEDRPDEHRGGSGRARGGHFEQVAGIILLCGVPAALLGLGGGWWLTRRALALLEALTKAVERTHEVRRLWSPALQGHGVASGVQRPVFCRQRCGCSHVPRPPAGQALGVQRLVP